MVRRIEEWRKPRVRGRMRREANIMDIISRATMEKKKRRYIHSVFTFCTETICSRDFTKLYKRTNMPFGSLLDTLEWLVRRIIANIILSSISLKIIDCCSCEGEKRRERYCDSYMFSLANSSSLLELFFTTSKFLCCLIWWAACIHFAIIKTRRLFQNKNDKHAFKGIDPIRTKIVTENTNSLQDHKLFGL